MIVFVKACWKLFTYVFWDYLVPDFWSIFNLKNVLLYFLVFGIFSLLISTSSFFFYWLAARSGQSYFSYNYIPEPWLYRIYNIVVKVLFGPFIEEIIIRAPILNM